MFNKHVHFFFENARGFGPIPPRGIPVTAKDWGVIAMVLSQICPSPAVGAMFSCPFITRMQQDGHTVCEILGTGNQVTIRKFFPLGVICVGHDMLVDHHDPTVLHVGESSLFVELTPPVASKLTLVELCAGVGGIGIGASLCGFRTICQVDINQLAVGHLHQLRMGSVLCMDITKDNCFRHIHELGHVHVTTVAAGFNCQPFSYLGDCRGMKDSRALSLIGTLRGVYLMQPQSLVLECTPGAGLDFQVRETLSAFLALMNWTSQDITFDLGDQWQCRRVRWWIICYPKTCSEIPFVAWPVSSKYATVGQVIPEWPVWSPEELAILRLNEEELEAYFCTYPDSQRILDMNSPAPTFLHSYGNATGRCPCGCRSTGFCPSRLCRDGLRGFMIHDTDGLPRFLHPREVAFLLSFPAGFPILSKLRDTLCLLGQSAAPLQSLWVFLHLKAILTGVQDRPFLDALQDLQTQLLFAKYHLWPVPSTCEDRQVTVQTTDDITLSFRVVGPCPVLDLLAAERINLSWGQQTFLLDGGVRVPTSALLRSQGFYGPYTLVRTMKHQPRDLGEGLLVVTLQGGDFDCFEMVFIPCGSFIFELLQSEQVPGFSTVTDEHGRLLRLDMRLWHSQTLMVFDRVGYGLCPFDLGLHMDFVGQATCFLHSLVPNPDDFVLIGITRLSTGWQQCFGTSLHQPPQEGKTYLFCCLFDQHWSLCVVRIPNAECVVGNFHLDFADGFRHRYVPPCIQHFVTFLEDLWFLECSHLCFDNTLHQTQKHTCGTILLGYVAHAFGLLHSRAVPRLEALHDGLALLSAMTTVDLSCRGFGKRSPQEQLVLHKLEVLLKEKGVPPDRVEERANLGLQKLGLKELDDAFQSANPWIYLKAVASRPHVSFQWIRADELQTKIAARASSKFHIQKHKSKQGAKKTPSAPLWVDPEQLALVAGTFVAQDLAVPQIAFSDVSPSAVGLAFCSVADAMPFLRAGKHISSKPLGILTTTTIPNDQIGTMQVQQLRFPAQFKGTNEPVLLQGSLVLLSPAQITRAVQSVECKLSSIPTQTLRLYVYKDQWEGSWEDFCAQPVRSLLQQIPLLQLCRDQACGEACPKYHAAVDEPLDNLLMDLWARSWHRSDSKYTKPEHAAYWSVLVRIPISANLTIQGQSGVHGFFAEPRTASGKEVDDSFGMIWLGELSLPDICHRLKTTQGAIAIGRLRSKFGLRFRAADLEQGFAQLKPSEPFVGAKMQQVYRLYPLPFGTQRAALQKCLTDWGWTAKVRQSVGGGDAGMAWEVGAASDPPSPILSLPDGKGDVAITLQKAVMKPSEPPALLASAATKKYLQTNQASSSSAQVDPWVQSDPWGNYRATTAPPRGTDKFQQLEDRLTSSLQSVRKEVAGASDVATDISALENRLQTSLLESVRQEFAGQWTRQEDQEMDGFQSNTNDRLQKLESGMSELHATNQKFEGWFNQLHRADQTLSAQVEAVTQQVDQQGHRIEKINTDLVSQVGGLQTGLNTVQQDVSNGFTRMEALLEKRAKTS